MGSAEFVAMGASMEWHLNETQLQARRAKIDALKAASVDWPRMNPSQVQSYHAEYGTGTMDGIDITTMPYMVLSDAIGLPPPLYRRQPGSGIGIPQGRTLRPGYIPWVRGPGYDERVKEMDEDGKFQTDQRIRMVNTFPARFIYIPKNNDE